MDPRKSKLFPFRFCQVNINFRTEERGGGGEGVCFKQIQMWPINNYTLRFFKMTDDGKIMTYKKAPIHTVQDHTAEMYVKSMFANEAFRG